jgi:hypothetical protein
MPGFFKSGNWNENNLNPLTRINWRASLVPAAAVIPAPIAYINVVAVKKLVVGFLVGAAGPPQGVYLVVSCHPCGNCSGIKLSGLGNTSFTVKKLECLKQAYAVEYISME